MVKNLGMIHGSYCHCESLTFLKLYWDEGDFLSEKFIYIYVLVLGFQRREINLPSTDWYNSSEVPSDENERRF